jgi:hypothetical protein
MTAKKWSFTSHDALGRGVASMVAKLHNCKLYRAGIFKQSIGAGTEEE